MSKHGWTYKKLGEICQSDLGKTLNHSTDTGKLYPYLCAINILWDKIDLSTLKETRFEDSEIERYSIKKGDLLICEGGDAGRAAIWEHENTILYQNALHRVRFYEEYYARFYMYFLRFLKDTGVIDSRYAKGVTIKHLVKSALLSLSVPSPEYNIQQQIVAELDAINESISLLQEQVKDLDALAQSIFYDMFGDNSKYEKITIGEVVKEMHLGPFGSALKNDCFVDKAESFCMVYEQQHAIKQTLELPTRYINKEKYNELKRFAVQGGDILMSCRGTIGKLYILPDDAPSGIIHPSLMMIRLDRGKIDDVYFLHTLKSIIDDLETNGATIKMAITATKLKEIEIPFPSMYVQQSFASKVAAIEDAKTSLNAQIKEMQTLLASRMQYWFD